MTKPANRKSGRKGKPQPDFHRQMVLFQWALGKFGIEKQGPNDDLLKRFRERFQIGPETEGGINPNTGRHRFFESIINVHSAAAGDIISLDKLEEYEQNILEHTLAINTRRDKPIAWKYFQYLALLFTDMFLDHYFDDPDSLRDELNERIKTHNDSAIEDDQVEPFDENDEKSAREQLARLAFWCATGSGKTLLMHIHILQFRHYHRMAFKAGKWSKLDQVILVTPNDGLSRQHLSEFKVSGIEAVAAGERGTDGLFAEQTKHAVKILDIHKFRDEQGDKTVATESFEGCNLVLVDEGHRGAGSGKEGAWLQRREQLAKGGFVIEYSATFKEAVQGDDEMRNRYARSILFDYAYRSFYRDGYGKDFTILNLEDDEDQQRNRYLTAAILLFYQQMKVWKDGGDRIKPFLVDKPLWVFVGHTVVGKAKNKEDKETISDVAEVLMFLNRFLTEKNHTINTIRDLLEQGFIDHDGRNLLDGRLSHIDTSGDKEKLSHDLYTAILGEVFHAPSDGGRLAVQILKRADGELALKIGEAEPFGVVNVGDPVAVANACDEKGVTRLEDDEYRPSLFHGINRDDSPINMLVGSRKFTEGWNSWRVSSIGLMRMGRGEGTQIIQLFGRGVRLRGYRMGLRRSSVLTQLPPQPNNLRQVETLQVFGVRATYMNKFKEWIVSELPEAQDRQIWVLPVIKTLPKRKLKTLRLKEIIEGVKVERGKAFRQLGPLVKLRPPDPNDPADIWLRSHPTRLNWLPRIHGLTGKDKKVSTSIGTQVELEAKWFTGLHVAMMDIDNLLFGLETFKATHCLDRLHADRETVRKLLIDENKTNWYRLLATPEDMRPDRYENRAQWQRMARQLINNYAERFYKFMRNRWEAPYIEVVEIDEDNPSIIENYNIESNDLAQTPAHITEIEDAVAELKTAIQNNALAPWNRWSSEWKTVPFAGHLYQPLLYVGKNTMIRISPVSLNGPEAQFVNDLADWCTKNEGIEVYLLRNQAVTGLGFFQASNFFPDFLLWVQNNNQEHLAFVDPKGLHHFNQADPKVQFATQEIPRIQNIINKQSTDLLLHAFLICDTAYSELNWAQGTGSSTMSKDEIEALGIFFQKDDPDTYIDAMMNLITASVSVHCK